METYSTEWQMRHCPLAISAPRSCLNAPVSGGNWMSRARAGRVRKAPSTKRQAPEKHQPPSFDHAAVWCLVLEASLELGAWCFELFISRRSDPDRFHHIPHVARRVPKRFYWLGLTNAIGCFDF